MQAFSNSDVAGYCRYAQSKKHHFTVSPHEEVGFNFCRTVLETDKRYSSFQQRPTYKIYNAEQSIWIAKNKSGKASENKTTCVQQNIRTPEQLKWLYEITVCTEHPCFGASLEDLDWSLIETYAEKVHEDKGDMQNREILLARLKFFSPLADNPTLHQSAVLCFATHPERLYSQAKSNFVFDVRGDNSFERYEITGPLNSQIKELIRRTRESLRRTSSIADSGERVEKYEIDLDVIRELISNAVTHRDYQSNGVVKVTVNSDYVEIQNPGSFPDLLSWTELLKCSAYPVSKPVNGAISHYLANLVVFEGIGRGFRIIHNYITEHGKESIKFKELPGPTTSVRILRPREQNLVQGNTFTNTGGGDQNIAQGEGAIGKQENATQEVSRDGNIVSGNGPVHVEHHHYPTTGSNPTSLLPGEDTIFLHREEELAWLDKHLYPDKVVAICAPGGMGKTALAARALRQLPPDRFPDPVIFHTFYHQPGTAQALQTIARALHLPTEEDWEQQVRAALGSRRALLVLDGAEEAEDFDAVLRLRGTCGVLITTRKRDDCGSLRLDLAPLPEEQAREVLRAYSKMTGEEEAIQGIEKILGGWPVALRMAGNYLRSTGESAADYLRWLEQEPLRELGDGQHQDGNAALLLRRSVAQVGEDSRLVLGLAGTLAFASLAIDPMTVLMECDKLRTRNAVNELVNYALLERQGERYQISHALIHSYARTNLTLNKERLQQVAAYYIEFCQTQNEAGLEGYAHLDRERAHCLHLLTACLTNELWQEIKALVATIEEYLDRQGHWSERLAVFNIRLTAAQQAGDRREQRHCLVNLGYTCLRSGELEQALHWFEQSLAIDREWGNRRGEGATLNNIGNIYQQLGRYDQALELYQQSLHIARASEDREGEGATLNNLGQLCYYQKDYEQALHYYEQCLPLRQEAGDTIGQGATLNNIATIRRAQGELTKALEYHQQALVISRELGDRAGEAQSCLNIGLTYHDLGDLAQAEEHIALAVQIAEAIGYPDLEEWRKQLERVREIR